MATIIKKTFRGGIIKEFYTKHSLNIWIVIVSLILTVIFFNISLNTIDIWHEFFVNVSASMLLIAVTVILIDVLRERRLERQYKIPREVAMNKILGAHSVISLTLALKNSSKDASILKDIMSYVKEYSSKTNALGFAAKDAFIKLENIPVSAIVQNLSQQELISTFKTQVENIRKNYSDTTDKYVFSFSDIVMRADYAELVEALDSVIGALDIIEMNSGELEKILKPKDKPNPDQPVTSNEFLGTVLVNYIKVFNRFFKTYSAE